MLDIANDIQSLTTFRRKSGEFMKRLKKTKRAVVLTVNGKAEAVVQDAEAYQRLLDAAARADIHEAIRQASDDIARGGLEKAIQSLEEFPKRCPRAPESRIAGLKLRNLLYGNKPNVYRVVFRIDEGKKRIRVLTIRHAAMDKLLLRRPKRETS
ncbi:MAG: type II toxin-antitoxin system prevent-host-death family antitoxin [Candidatus Acidiferrales bacterium]